MMITSAAYCIELVNYFDLTIYKKVRLTIGQGSRTKAKF